MLRLAFFLVVVHASPLSVFAQGDDLNDKLLRTFSRVVQVYPSDSASLYTFYFEYFPSTDSAATVEHIARLENLLSEDMQRRYRTVVRELRPLLVKIVHAKSIDRQQARKFVTLYSTYDRFKGEALFSHLLSDDDNYRLVHVAFGKLAGAAKKDTSFILALILLSHSVRTNVELAEGVPSYVRDAIRNNPEGFLLMYAKRNKVAQEQLLEFVAPDGTPDEKLMRAFEIIAQSKNHPRISSIARELMESLRRHD
jgi:hypothetical protein